MKHIIFNKIVFIDSMALLWFHFMGGLNQLSVIIDEIWFLTINESVEPNQSTLPSSIPSALIKIPYKALVQLYCLSYILITTDDEF